jgi:endoglycosylceramidase
VRPLKTVVLIAFVVSAAVGCGEDAVPNAGSGVPTASPSPTPPTQVVSANGVVYPADADGRAMLLRGWEFSRDACDNDPFADAATEFPRIASLGFNAVRVPFNWECIEPTAGEYDAAYLASYDKVFRAAEQAHLMVTADLNDHIPLWVLEKTGRKPTTSALGKHGDRQFLGGWGLIYTDAVVRRHVIDLWTMMAHRLGNQASLFGYDLFNEPWYDPIAAGAGLVDFQAALEAEATQLTPMYQDLTDAVRTVDHAHWVLVEPFWAAEATFNLPTHLGEIHDPDHKVAYSPHIYNSAMEAGGDYNPASGFVDAYWAAANQYPRQYQLPVLISEWGTRNPKTPNAGRYVQDVLAGVDDYAAGYMAFAWCQGLAEWCNLADDGTPGAAMSLTVSAFPRRIAGTPVEIVTRPEEMRLQYNPTGEQPTEIVVPRAAFPTGYGVTINGGQWSATSGETFDLIAVRADRGATVVDVAISRTLVTPPRQAVDW